MSASPQTKGEKDFLNTLTAQAPKYASRQALLEKEIRSAQQARQDCLSLGAGAERLGYWQGYIHALDWVKLNLSPRAKNKRGVRISRKKKP